MNFEINLKKIIILFMLIYGLLSCSEGDRLKNYERFEKFEIILIDSCEYIQYGGAYGAIHIAHKGNCKYCSERFKLLLKQELIKE